MSILSSVLCSELVRMYVTECSIDGVGPGCVVNAKESMRDIERMRFAGTSTIPWKYSMPRMSVRM